MEPSIQPSDNAAVEARDGPATTFISVLVCTRARPVLLERCLSSLAALDDADHEVVVVDNNRVPQACTYAGGAVRVVHEPRPGLGYARNKGIKEARGQIVVFIDDDCEASPEWLRELRSGFDDPAVTCVTGRVRPASTALPSHRWFERLASFDRGATPTRHVHPRAGAVWPTEAALLGTGCNMAFRTDVFDRVGTFDPALDTPALIRGGGDLDIFVRVLEAGEIVAYVPSANVRHHHRNSLYELARQLFGYGVGLGALSIKYILEGRAGWRDVIRFQRQFLRWIYGGSKRGGSRMIGLPLIALEIVGDIIGPFAYVVVRRRNHRPVDG